MSKKVPVCELPVMVAHCSTCPFKPDANGIWQDVALANTVTSRTLFKGQQICHSTEKKNRKATHRCKGSYDQNKEIYARMGLDHLLK